MSEQTGLLTQLREFDRRVEQVEVIERPPLYLPWSMETLTPFPLASSGGVSHRMPLPWSVSIRAFYCSVIVAGTNNGTNYWNVALVTGTPTFTVVSSFNTSAIAAGIWVRFAPSIANQPASTDIELEISLTATLSPGSIYLVPAVALFRTGN